MDVAGIVLPIAAPSRSMTTFGALPPLDPAETNGEVCP
jgi:hypothetical protein